MSNLKSKYVSANSLGVEPSSIVEAINQNGHSELKTVQNIVRLNWNYPKLNWIGLYLANGPLELGLILAI